MNNSTDLIMTPEFSAKLDAFQAEWYDRYVKISHEPTPQIDGAGREILRHRPDGYKYVEESWIRDRLNRYFPGWSLEKGGLQFLGSEWVCADGTLIIIDPSLLALGITPPLRRFWAADAVRIQYKKDSEHIPDNIIDIGDNTQAAISNVLKRAANRLCGIADDVYDNLITSQGAGTYRTVFVDNPTAINFANWVLSHKGTLISEICAILGVNGLTEIGPTDEDWMTAYDKVTKAKRW